MLIGMTFIKRSEYDIWNSLKMFQSTEDHLIFGKHLFLTRKRSRTYRTAAPRPLTWMTDVMTSIYVGIMTSSVTLVWRVFSTQLVSLYFVVLAGKSCTNLKRVTQSTVRCMNGTTLHVLPNL